jgi:hypothetical protein
MLPSTGFDGGAVLLSPQYPRDPIIFGVGDATGSGIGMSLVRSDDNGRSFSPLSTTYVTQVVMDSSSPVGDARLVMAADEGTQLLTYHAASRLVSPGPSLPPDAGTIMGLLAAQDAPDIFVSTVTATERRIYDCTSAGGCVRIPCPAQPSDACTPSMVSPTYSADHLLLTRSTASVEILHVPDGAWRQIAYPDGWQAYWGPLVRFDFATTHHLDLFMHPSSTGWSTPASVWRSEGGAFGLIATRSFDDTADNGRTLTDLPDGRLIVGSPGDASHWGISCSSDGGATWVAGC